MSYLRLLPRSSALLLLATLTIAARAADAYFDESKVTTFFAFDNVSIPYTQNLRVKMRQGVKHPRNPVVPRGPAGSVDAWAVQFYGSIVREGDKLRMWYSAVSDLPSP